MVHRTTKFAIWFQRMKNRIPASGVAEEQEEMEEMEDKEGEGEEQKEDQMQEEKDQMQEEEEEVASSARNSPDDEGTRNEEDDGEASSTSDVVPTISLAVSGTDPSVAEEADAGVSSSSSSSAADAAMEPPESSSLETTTSLVECASGGDDVPPPVEVADACVPAAAAAAAAVVVVAPIPDRSLDDDVGAVAMTAASVTESSPREGGGASPTKSTDVGSISVSKMAASLTSTGTHDSIDAMGDGTTPPISRPCDDVTPAVRRGDRVRVLYEVADMFGDSRKEW
jgi:hypothetical protein